MSQDRRRSARTHAEHTCKVLHRASHRFYPGKTCDVSGNGAMVILDTAHPLWPGEELSVYIAWNNEAGVISQRFMTEARVVRVAGTTGDRQAVALEFAEPVSLSPTAMSAA